jgi:hypothetical protein
MGGPPTPTPVSHPRRLFDTGIQRYGYPSHELGNKRQRTLDETRQRLEELGCEGAVDDSVVS